MIHTWKPGCSRCGSHPPGWQHTPDVPPPHPLYITSRRFCVCWDSDTRGYVALPGCHCQVPGRCCSAHTDFRVNVDAAVSWAGPRFISRHGSWCSTVTASWCWCTTAPSTWDRSPFPATVRLPAAQCLLGYGVRSAGACRLDGTASLVAAGFGLPGAVSPCGAGAAGLPAFGVSLCDRQQGAVVEFGAWFQVGSFDDDRRSFVPAHAASMA